MDTPRKVPEYEAVEGPFDGSLLPYYGREQVVKVFESSTCVYRYVLEAEDTGAPFWRFAGLVGGGGGDYPNKPTGYKDVAA